MTIEPVRFTPAVQLETLFVLSESGRIVSTREPNPTPGPLFSLIRGQGDCVWAVHADVPKDVARCLETLALDERPAGDFEDAPSHQDEYVSLLGGTVESGPVFTFPEPDRADAKIVAVKDVRQLARHFPGWTTEELPERAPVVAICEGSDAVSVCFCARRTAVAAEAGLETAERFRGRGFGPRVTAAWARAIRALGILPMYSTSWQNRASLAVARKLCLNACASDWNVIRM